jgi:hypothetical protein
MSRFKQRENRSMSPRGNMRPHRKWFISLFWGTLTFSMTTQNTAAIAGEGPAAGDSERSVGTNTDRPLLSPGQWNQVDSSVDRALEFLSQRQNRDGSFTTHDSGQPAVTSLCVMAFLSRGHVPNQGQYGRLMVRAIDYVLDMQAPDGVIMKQRVSRIPEAHFEGNYNHAISGLMLGEVYGMTDPDQHERIREVIEQAIRFSRNQQLRRGKKPGEQGGWRYMRPYRLTDSDLSVTAWQLMFLRSARNAEFEVPEQYIQDAMGYIRRSFDPQQQGFVYGLYGTDRYCSRGMVGAGIVSLALGGEHQSDIAHAAGRWILDSSFERYNHQYRHHEDRYHYSAFYCSQAMFQLGGDYWHQFYPRLLKVLAENQNSDGSWDRESNGNDHKYGNLYTTALTVLTLTPPYQILPIYQR